MRIQTLLLLSIIGFFCNGVFADATGICKDGFETSGTNKRSACRGHDGIKEWYGDKSAKSDAEPEQKTKSKKTKEKEEEASGPATGVCKDGYETSGTNKRSACRGHDGIKEWYADKDKDAPTEKSKTKTTAKSDTSEAAATGAITGVCKDGFETSGTNKRSACRGHKGIKDWYADKDKAAPADKTVTKSKSKEPAPAAATEEDESEMAEPDKKAPPVRKRASRAASSGDVWVNTKSKIYHCEDSRFYGQTKEGEYMSEAEAEKQGYRANRNKTCSSQ